MGLIALLSIARAVFFFRPNVQVRAVYLRIFLLLCLIGVVGYAVHTYDGTSTTVIRYGLVAALLVIPLVVLPRGVLDEAQKKTFLEYVDSIVVAGVTALLLIWFVVRSFYIPSESMVPTLQVNDMILVNEVIYRFREPTRGDIVVFHPPPAAHSEGKDFIKRIMAVGGDTLQVKDNVTLINGQPVDEPFRRPDMYVDDFGPVKIPQDNVFVMGDNRTNSEDSRFWGVLPTKNIIGKAFVIFFPMHRLQMLR